MYPVNFAVILDGCIINQNLQSVVSIMNEKHIEYVCDFSFFVQYSKTGIYRGIHYFSMNFKGNTEFIRAVSTQNYARKRIYPDNTMNLS